MQLGMGIPLLWSSDENRINTTCCHSNGASITHPSSWADHPGKHTLGTEHAKNVRPSDAYLPQSPPWHQKPCSGPQPWTRQLTTVTNVDYVVARGYFQDCRPGKVNPGRYNVPVRISFPALPGVIHCHHFLDITLPSETKYAYTLLSRQGF